MIAAAILREPTNVPLRTIMANSALRSAAEDELTTPVVRKTKAEWLRHYARELGVGSSDAFEVGDDVQVIEDGTRGNVTAIVDGEFVVEGEDGEPLGTFDESELRGNTVKTPGRSNRRNARDGYAAQLPRQARVTDDPSYQPHGQSADSYGLALGRVASAVTITDASSGAPDSYATALARLKEGR